jgi:dolichyl-phosphate-mannose--protein O-mannosyl transferase
MKTAINHKAKRVTIKHANVVEGYENRHHHEEPTGYYTARVYFVLAVDEIDNTWMFDSKFESEYEALELKEKVNAYGSINHTMWSWQN